MKALTISQPYASLIASGAKWVENRTWYTKYRGPIAIHAGKGTQYLNHDELANYETGCVIAIARLAACVSKDEIRRYNETPKIRKKKIDMSNRNWSEVARHKHTEGPWCWILTDARALAEPVPISGKQGLWDWNGHYEDTRKS